VAVGDFVFIILRYHHASFSAAMSAWRFANERRTKKDNRCPHGRDACAFMVVAMHTTTPISEQIGTAPPIVVAQWLRIPDAVRASGLCRSSLYSLMRTGRVRSVCLRPSNGQKGIRLINAVSLNHYIESQEADYSESVSASALGARSAHDR
jgi:hypothetical protein